MGGFLAELGKKLAERWLSVLMLPGLLFVGVLLVAHTLGHTRSFDLTRLTSQLEAWTAAPWTARPSGLAVVLIGVALAAAGAGLAAQGLGSLIERVWLAERWRSWPTPARQLASIRTRRRHRRWAAATEARQRELDARIDRLAHRARAPGTDAPADQPLGPGSRIAPEEPTRPTWVGDRMDAVVVRMDRDYQLDVATVWPHLWLSMPETTRAEITTAREALARSSTLAGWGLLYLAVGALCWPGLLIPAVLVGTAWRHAKAATESYGLLVEAAVRLNTADLARSMGIEHAGPLDRRTGFVLTCLLQGRGDLIPLTTGWPRDVETEPAAPTSG